MKYGICAYCMKEDGTTKDHIPPQCIFPKPRATELIWVPCCESCREGWSEDDEEFRRYIWSAEGVEGHTSFEKASNQIISSIKRPEAKLYRNKILSSISSREEYSESGIFLGNKTLMEIEWDRIERVLKRIVRGLFFKENNQLIPGDHEVIIKSYDKNIFDEVDKFQFKKMANVCDGIFQYWLCKPNNEENTSLWIMVFCNSTPYLGYIRSIKNANNPPKPFSINTDSPIK